MQFVTVTKISEWFRCHHLMISLQSLSNRVFGCRNHGTCVCISGILSTACDLVRKGWDRIFQSERLKWQKVQFWEMEQRLRNLNMLKMCAWPSERADLTALSAWHRAAWLLDPQSSSKSTDFGLMPFQLIAAAIWLGYDWDWKISVGSAVRCKAVRGSEHRDERLDQTILVRLTKTAFQGYGAQGKPQPLRCYILPSATMLRLLLSQWSWHAAASWQIAERKGFEAI